jgi:DNA-binding HxlR family transcriptional regulator
LHNIVKLLLYNLVTMRSYGQYCALAKSLDVVGDRWTLLIVRELALRGSARYTDLRAGLPGIATNLLASRLRDLERSGVVAREDAPPPIATTIFKLTPRGEELRPVLDALGRWGVPYMAEGPAPEDEFRGRWLAWPAEFFLVDREPDAAPIAIVLRVGEEPMVLETADGEVHARPGDAVDPDAVLTGGPHEILGVLSGQLDLAAARARGVSFEGDERALARVIPAAA